MNKEKLKIKQQNTALDLNQLIRIPSNGAFTDSIINNQQAIKISILLLNS